MYLLLVSHLPGRYIILVILNTLVEPFFVPLPERVLPPRKTWSVIFLVPPLAVLSKHCLMPSSLNRRKERRTIMVLPFSKTKDTIQSPRFLPYGNWSPFLGNNHTFLSRLPASGQTAWRISYPPLKRQMNHPRSKGFLS